DRIPAHAISRRRHPHRRGRARDAGGRAQRRAVACGRDARDQHARGRSAWRCVTPFGRLMTRTKTERRGAMLADKDVQATVTVKSLDAAKRFYEGALGLKRTGGNETGALLYKCGSSTLLVYESQFAGTNKATAATWVIREGIEGFVEALKKKGVAFEH